MEEKEGIAAKHQGTWCKDRPWEAQREMQWRACMRKAATKLIASLYKGSKISGKPIKDLRAYLDSLEEKDK